MKNLSKVLLCLLSIALVLACFAACGSTSSVTFNAGENESFVVEVKKGDKVCPPAVDCAEGVYIEGWYDNEQKTGDKFDFDSAVSSDLTLWARYESSVYRASYDLNYPDCVNPQSVEFTKEGDISLAQAPMRLGYRFLGWSDGSGLFAAGSVYDVSESALKDVVFSARWETATVTVEFLETRAMPLTSERFLTAATCLRRRLRPTPILATSCRAGTCTRTTCAASRRI